MFDVLFRPSCARASAPLLKLLAWLLVDDALPERARLQRVVPPHLGHALLEAPLPLRREEHGVEASVVEIDGTVVAEEAGVDRGDLVVVLPEDSP